MGGERIPSAEEESSPEETSTFLENDAHQRRRSLVYSQILQSYDDVRIRTNALEEAKSRILSYTPGAWIEMSGGMKFSDYNVPETTSLILVGPKGSGKSSLINKISRVFEDDKFAPERAQVSYNLSVGDGTYFLQEYMIPRGSTSFCLYDTRGLSDVSSDNMQMLKHWITKGVRHGELAIRNSDSPSIRARMKCKARQSGYNSSKTRLVNFVIFVVNGLSVLKSIDSCDDGASQFYIQTIAEMFCCPYLSFRDDMPVVVVTHGDLLSLSDRARVRVHLGEHLGISPGKQIFDIPESCGKATELTIIDMLRYSLEHADRNLPCKGWFLDKGRVVPLMACIFLLIILWLSVASTHIYRVHMRRAHPKVHTDFPPEFHIDWHAIRHLW